MIITVNSNDAIGHTATFDHMVGGILYIRKKIYDYESYIFYLYSKWRVSGGGSSTTATTTTVNTPEHTYHHFCCYSHMASDYAFSHFSYVGVSFPHEIVSMYPGENV